MLRRSKIQTRMRYLEIDPSSTLWSRTARLDSKASSLLTMSRSAPSSPLLVSLRPSCTMNELTNMTKVDSSSVMTKEWSLSSWLCRNFWSASLKSLMAVDSTKAS